MEKLLKLLSKCLLVSLLSVYLLPHVNIIAASDNSMIKPTVNINVDYSGVGKIYADIVNFTEFQQSGINVILAGYDASEALVSVEAASVDKLDEKDGKSIKFAMLDNEIRTTDTIKIMVWERGVKPYTKSVYVKRQGEIVCSLSTIEQLIAKSKNRDQMPRYIYEKNLNDDLTEYDFAQLVVHMIEAITGKEMPAVDEEYFKDTDDINIRKLVGTGICMGRADGTYAPENSMINPYCMVIINRTIAYICGGYQIFDDKESEPFDNHEDIPLWAKDATHQVKSLGVLDSVYGNTLSSTKNITIGQAVAIVENIYRLFYD